MKRKLYFWIFPTDKHDACHYCGEKGAITYIDVDGDTISLCTQCDDNKDERFFSIEGIYVNRR